MKFCRFFVRLESLLSQFHPGKSFEHLFLRWRLQDVTCCKLLSLRIVRLSNALRSFGEIVGRAPQLNVGPKQEPKGAWFAIRHSHTASIHNSNAPDHSVKLHVGMTADDHRYVDSCEGR